MYERFARRFGRDMTPRDFATLVPAEVREARTPGPKDPAYTVAEPTLSLSSFGTM